MDRGVRDIICFVHQRVKLPLLPRDFLTSSALDKKVVQTHYFDYSVLIRKELSLIPYPDYVQKIA